MRSDHLLEVWVLHLTPSVAQGQQASSCLLICEVAG